MQKVYTDKKNYPQLKKYHPDVQIEGLDIAKCPSW